MNREKYGSGGMMGASHEVRDLSNMGGIYRLTCAKIVQFYISGAA